MRLRPSKCSRTSSTRVVPSSSAPPRTATVWPWMSCPRPWRRWAGTAWFSRGAEGCAVRLKARGWARPDAGICCAAWMMRWRDWTRIMWTCGSWSRARRCRWRRPWRRRPSLTVAGAPATWVCRVRLTGSWPRRSLVVSWVSARRSRSSNSRSPSWMLPAHQR